MDKFIFFNLLSTIDAYMRPAKAIDVNYGIYAFDKNYQYKL